MYWLPLQCFHAEQHNQNSTTKTGVGWGAAWIAAGSRIVAWLGHGSQIGQLDLFRVAHQRVPDKCSVKRTGVVWQLKYNRRAAS